MSDLKIVTREKVPMHFEVALEGSVPEMPGGLGPVYSGWKRRRRIESASVFSTC